MNASAEGEPIDILLVEDNPGDVRLTREAFDAARINNTMHVVTDGEAALDFLFQRGEYDDSPRPTLVLLDLNLPKLGGLEVLETVKDEPELSCIPIVILTSSAAEEDIVRSYELHTNAYLTKPIGPDEFVEMVRSFEDFWFTLVRLPDDGER
ncbi:response regulator [Halorarum halobium]|uniref:response regulator n=1 Tax=Halorarum halobium TaxID=3075121 RepID=UPI0028A6E47D|nr:response regulator [Halobaculum sp. XH14]